jgi:hypothetical protein
MTHHNAIPQLAGSPPRSNFAEGGILDSHILELAAFEYLPAFQAFYEFRILFAGNDLHAGVAALLIHGTTHCLHGVLLRLR